MNFESSTNSVAVSVKQVLISVLELQLEVSELDEGLSLRSDAIGMDSLTLLHIIAKLEQELSFEIDDEAMMSAKLVDVGSLVELVRSHVVGRPAGNEASSAKYEAIE